MQETKQMTEGPQGTTGAVSGEVESWFAIDWQRANHLVKRLQARIVKATQAGRWVRCKPYNDCSPARSVPKPWRCDE